MDVCHPAAGAYRVLVTVTYFRIAVPPFMNDVVQTVSMLVRDRRTVMKRIGFAVVLSLAMAGIPGAARATEGALGHYFPGTYVMPLAALMPPPGLYWNSMEVYYSATSSRNLQIPVAGQIRAGLSAVIVGTTFTGLWVPDVDIAPNTSLSFSVSIPVDYVRGRAQFGTREVTEDQVALGDIMFAPTIGWRSGNNFLSASLRVWAPTGAYRNGALDNPGMNYWTFTPTLSYTYFDMKRGLDLSVVAGIDFNTRNPDTDYTSGALAHVDVSLMQYLSKKFAIGVLGAMLYQIEDDKGPLADRFGGFRGRSFAAGPILKYTAGTEKNPVNIALSWAPEFGQKNRIKGGNGVYLSISGKF